MTGLRKHFIVVPIALLTFVVFVQTIAAADLKIKAKVPGIT
jgi:hypothetical protein